MEFVVTTEHALCGSAMYLLVLTDYVSGMYCKKQLGLNHVVGLTTILAMHNIKLKISLFSAQRES